MAQGRWPSLPGQSFRVDFESPLSRHSPGRTGWRLYYKRIRQGGVFVLFVIYFIVCPDLHRAGHVINFLGYGIFPLAGFFYFTLGMTMRKLNSIFCLNKKMAAALFLSGVILAWAQAYCRLNEISLAGYFGCLSIPLMLVGVWSFAPANAWPKFMVVASFPIYLVHKFFYPLAYKTVGAQVTLWQYAVTALLVFGASLLCVTLLRKFLPKVMSIAWGGR